MQRAAGVVAGAIVAEPSRAQGTTRSTAAPAASTPAAPLFRISLAQWSLHRAFYAKELDPVDFPKIAKEQYGIDAVEYVSTFYKDHARSRQHWLDLRSRADDLGVRSLLIMVDGEGAIGDPDAAARAATVENHRQWLDAAHALGCHSIRVNAESRGGEDEQRNLVVDGLRRLAEAARPLELNVIVENHGGLSSNGAWLASVMRAAADPRIGTLPDFGNFCFDWSRAADPAAWYDRYQGVRELMPFARAVSAKSHDFDAAGNETKTDFRRMLRIVLDAGYRGHVGIEYEGTKHTEPEGIRATRSLLERVHAELTRPEAPAPPPRP